MTVLATIDGLESERCTRARLALPCDMSGVAGSGLGEERTVTALCLAAIPVSAFTTMTAGRMSGLAESRRPYKRRLMNYLYYLKGVGG